MGKWVVLTGALAMLSPVADAAPGAPAASKEATSAPQTICGCKTKCDGKGERCLITCNANDAGACQGNTGNLGRNYLRVGPTGVLEVPVPAGSR
jgi:hypothetical protein